MSKAKMLRALVKQRLTAAAEEIFGLFERTIAEYEEELSRSKEENERQQKLLDVLNPQLQLHRADVQQLLVVKEELPPEQQDWSSGVDQEDPEPPHIKEEQEELWSRQDGEQLEGLKEADIKFTLTSVPVKTEEDDEDKAQSSQLHQRQTEQMETEADGEDCGGPEPDRNSDTHLKPHTHDKTSRSETETDANIVWQGIEEPQSGSNSVQSTEPPVSDSDCNTGKTSVSSSECATSFDHKERTRMKPGEKRFSCSVCGKKFTRHDHLKRHFTVHTGDRPFSCSICNKSFAQKGQLKHHYIVHTGEKPFSCSICGKGFTSKGDLKRHFTVHTGEKRFGCSVCGRRFADESNLRRHLKIHAKQKLWFGCSSCGSDSHKNST